MTNETLAKKYDDGPSDDFEAPSTSHSKKKPVNLKSGTTFLSKLGGAGEFKEEGNNLTVDSDNQLQTLQRLESLEEQEQNDQELTQL